MQDLAEIPPELHTPFHRQCRGCELERRRLIQNEAFSPHMRFLEAAERFLSSRKRLRPKTLYHYRDYARQLGEFFGGALLEEIHAGTILCYQRARQAQIRASSQHAAVERKLKRGMATSDGASKINHEISCVLRPILRRAGLWENIENFYEPLPVPAVGSAMALSEAEEKHLFATAKLRPAWLVAYCCALLTRNTTRGFSELRHLRVGRVHLGDRPAILIQEGAKNRQREGTVPLNEDARWAARALLTRYLSLCDKWKIDPNAEHFLLPYIPHKRGAPPDFSRPQASIKKAWENMRRKAAEQMPRLAGVRYYDLRHTGATIMLEDPALSFGTIETMLGHALGSKTKKKYQHIRDSRLRLAAQRLCAGHAPSQALAPGAPATQASSAPAKYAPSRASGAPLSSTISFLKLLG